MSKGILHHVALSVQAFDWYQNFFQEIFGMTIRKTQGEIPKRQIWFHEGIQLNEATEVGLSGSSVDHISIAVADIPQTVETALKKGCKPCSKGTHWFILPNDVKIELMQL